MWINELPFLDKPFGTWLWPLIFT